MTLLRVIDEVDGLAAGWDQLDDGVGRRRGEVHVHDAQGAIAQPDVQALQVRGEGQAVGAEGEADRLGVGGGHRREVEDVDSRVGTVGHVQAARRLVDLHRVEGG